MSKWVVLGVDLDVAGYDAMPRFDTEAEAVACAQQYLDRQRTYQQRHGAFGLTGTEDEARAATLDITVAKVVYEARAFNVEPAKDLVKALGFDWQFDYRLQKDNT